MSDYMITYNCPECRKLLAKVARLERKLRKARPAKCSTCKEAKFSRDLKRAAALAEREIAQVRRAALGEGAGKGG